MINLSLNPYDSVAREALRALLDVYDSHDKPVEEATEAKAPEPADKISELATIFSMAVNSLAADMVPEPVAEVPETQPEQPEEPAGEQHEKVTREPGEDVETAEQQFVSKSEFETAYRAIYQKDPSVGKWVKDKLAAVRATRVSDLDDALRTTLYRELRDRYDPVPF